MLLVVQRDQPLRQRFTPTRERPISGGHDHLMREQILRVSAGHP